MITLAICWEAINVLAVSLSYTALILFGISAIADLCMSDSRRENMIGWVIAGTCIIAASMELYFIVAKGMCG